MSSSTPTRDKIMPELDFIDIKDANSDRTSSLSINGNTLSKGELCVLGVLEHGTVITFDNQNAQKLADYLFANFDITLPSLHTIKSDTRFG